MTTRRILFLTVLLLAPAGCAPRAPESPRPLEDAARGVVDAGAGRDHPIDDGERTMSEQDGSSGSSAESSISLPPPPVDAAIALEAAPRYVLGFPIMVSVTYQNRTNEISMGLPELVPWAVVNPRVGYRLVPVGGGPAIEERPARPLHGRGPEIGMAPSESRRMLVDLSNYHMVAGPGVYRLSVLVLALGNPVESAPVTVELMAPSAAEASESARLRALASPVRPDDWRAWWYFLTDYWGTPVLSPSLGAEAREQLALHLFYHRAFYGPEGPAQLDVARLGAITAPSLQAEVAVLKLELATARGDPEAPRLRESLLVRWPGLSHRVDDIDRGKGFITDYRRTFGAESHHAAKVAKRPYTP
jgi:hypothetical protein